QLRSAAVVAYQDVHVAVVIVIGGRQAAAYRRRLKIGAQPLADVGEDAFAHISEDQLRLGPTHSLVIAGDIIQDMAGGDKNVRTAIVIEIQETYAECAELECGVSELGGGCGVLEHSVAEAAIEARMLLVEVSDDEILPALAARIGGIDAHSS